MTCYNTCTQLFNALEMPFRVYCKKGCNGDADTIEECEEECKKLCYKDPVYKEYEWTKPLDRSPGARKYSERCEMACKKGCLFKLEKDEETSILDPPKSPKV